MKNLFITTIVFIIVFVGCNSNKETKKQNSDTTKIEVQKNKIKKTEKIAIEFEGEYLIGQEETEEYFQSLTIKNLSDKEYQVDFIASIVKGEPDCQFSGKGTVKNDTLFIPIKDWKKPVDMFIVANKDTLTVGTKNFDDRYALMYYCHGGGSLAGKYVKFIN